MVERSIRPIALYRKNVLFADTGGGAEHWAVIASLIEPANSTVSSNWAILRVFQQDRQRPPNSRIDDLLPWVYTRIPELKAAA
ncbi:transposase [Mesorhizobium sp. M0189]|uniref:transposase n=1 Tax=Mesorhizobium sp. M0189 TaxID=2956909 RepID=UPI00333B2EAB